MPELERLHSWDWSAQAVEGEYCYQMAMRSGSGGRAACMLSVCEGLRATPVPLAPWAAYYPAICVPKMHAMPRASCAIGSAAPTMPDESQPERSDRRRTSRMSANFEHVSGRMVLPASSKEQSGPVPVHPVTK